MDMDVVYNDTQIILKSKKKAILGHVITSLVVFTIWGIITISLLLQLSGIDLTQTEIFGIKIKGPG